MSPSLVRAFAPTLDGEDLFFTKMVGGSDVRNRAVEGEDERGPGIADVDLRLRIRRDVTTFLTFSARISPSQRPVRRSTSQSQSRTLFLPKNLVSGFQCFPRELLKRTIEAQSTVIFEKCRAFYERRLYED
jgi:hypothetical protein